MADIRIKDLTTTASSTASDDFIAVDGTTNGTRKLNAFSPTFGGNATVTGTLTANGLLTAAATTSLDGLPTAAIFGATKRVVLGYNTSSDYGFIASADSGTTWKELHLNPSGGVVKVPNTTSSTTTSSGALVVGNGTSGGLGVGGAVFTGGYVHPGGDSNFYIRTTGSSNGLIRANFLSADVASAFLVRNDTGTTEYVRVDSTGLIAAIPATAPSLTVNGTMTFERTSNTSLKISVRGTDGTTRSVSLTLA